MSVPTESTEVSHRSRTELARRAGAGIEVALFWRKSTNQVTVEVVDDRLGTTFELEVAGGDALRAFHHPYAYATRSLPWAAEAVGA